MNDTPSAVDAAQLKEFVPLFSLSQERLRELAVLSSIELIKPGVHLFHEGDVDNQTMYLLEGQVCLQGGPGDPEQLIVSGSPEARHAMGDNQPRQSSAVAVSESLVLRIDNNVLDYMITWDQLASLEQHAPATAGADEGSLRSDWMNRMLSALPFRSVPPANVRRLLKRVETVRARQGDVVVRQGKPGDYYYLITEGEARVTQQVELARLGTGASFGEEALISDSERNATVTMTSDGVLVRLSKQDFSELLKEPLLNWVSPGAARGMVNNGAFWLDVRHAKEYAHYRLPNATNLPLHELRQRMDELDKDACYVCYCKTGRRSSAAAFLLTRAGYDARILRGGLQVLPPLIRNLG
ncbi:MAG: cyclic nucleotide-binding domain-containing protein [Gammaproteobacteria bacterium]|nr:cyclic nucleotide-binding domain-containing protein [Gammaproteobacteria bacterium]NIR99245.1 cyclic nucleotide-binding domain-containing protein [Gammaproteobacteria bacterium]NIT64866.1 cyclic nucleotide-binding domain-containing protein [Gammaproteobacteria bacterium]NIV21816.1 cyclic nucleotide-binding domain-containing protein [Gammaproteobacteria bacterium]NIX10885.1 cyclic nucleotide-binding domain-containing protein [Gammaproteobacteria bacterium]